MKKKKIKEGEEEREPKKERRFSASKVTRRHRIAMSPPHVPQSTTRHDPAQPR